MNTFPLTNATGAYQLDMDGGVSCGGNPAGSWTTNSLNQIVITDADGGTATFDVAWLFNNKNQLTIQVANSEIFNFAAAGLRNGFTTRNGALVVKPDLYGDFSFTLIGTWQLDPDHNLAFTAGGVTSTLDGFISDPIGRFMFHFANKDHVLETNVLGFAGYWQSKVDANGTPLLDFHYQTPTGEAVFALPQAVAINRTSNQLSYSYSKGNLTPSIDFQGTLTIGADFSIAYVLERQVSSDGDPMAASTTLQFNSTLTEPNLHGDLQLAITKPDGSAGGTMLTIGGQCQGVLGKTNLQIGFTYTQTFAGAGNQITRTAAFSGSLTYAGGKVQWTFAATGSSIELGIGVDIQLGPVQLDARLNLPLDGGEVAGVSFLLGVSF